MTFVWYSLWKATAVSVEILPLYCTNWRGENVEGEGLVWWRFVEFYCREVVFVPKFLEGSIVFYDISGPWKQSFFELFSSWTFPENRETEGSNYFSHTGEQFLEKNALLEAFSPFCVSRSRAKIGFDEFANRGHCNCRVRQGSRQWTRWNVDKEYLCYWRRCRGVVLHIAFTYSVRPLNVMERQRLIELL